MIERNDTPFLAPSHHDVAKLQERAYSQRTRYQRLNRSFAGVRTAVTPFFTSPVRTIRNLPTRYLVHSVVALSVPVALGLSQLSPRSSGQAGTTATIMADAPVRLGPQNGEQQPFNLDQVGDPPLQPDDAMPMPISLTSRSEAVAPVAVSATVAEQASAKLRNGPGTEYDTVTELASSTSLQVTGRFGDWFQVRQGNSAETAWVSAELVDIPEAAVYTLFEVQESDIPPPPPPKVATVTTADLNLRDGPGSEYVRMMGLAAGQEVALIEQYEHWMHIATGDFDGWVHADHLDMAPGVLERVTIATTIPDANPAMMGTIAGGTVNVREGPGTAYATVGAATGGEQVDLLAYHGDWYRVQLQDGTSAWVFGDLVQVDPMVDRRVAYTDNIPALPAPAPLAVASEFDAAANPQATAFATAGKGTTAAEDPYSASASYSALAIPASGDVASYAVQFVGHPYVYGGASPGAFDCSGLVQYVYAQYGVSLPHNAAAQYNTAYGAVVPSINNLAPGDMVFFAGTAGPGITHVGLYIGGGRFVHAMMPGLGVQVSSLWEPYWMSHYYGGIRVYR
jgi:cell wall-associated NlpC family hydrolase